MIDISGEKWRKEEKGKKEKEKGNNALFFQSAFRFPSLKTIGRSNSESDKRAMHKTKTKTFFTVYKPLH